MGTLNADVAEMFAEGVAEIAQLNAEQQAAVRVAIGLSVVQVAKVHRRVLDDKDTHIGLLNKEIARLHTDLNNVRNELQRAQQVQEGKAILSMPAAVTANGHTNGNGNGAAPAVVVQAESEATATVDPTPAAGRNPYAFSWGLLDDKSREIVQALDDGKVAWRQVTRDDRLVIVQAAITELQLTLPSGAALAMEDFECRRPVWMSEAATITQTLGESPQRGSEG